MRLSKTELFTIDGKPMLAPDAGIKISFADIDASESGTDQAGNEHRVVVRYDATTWTFSYFALSEEEYAYMSDIFPKAPDFTFCHPSLTDRTKKVSVRSSRKKRSISWRNVITGEFRNLTFSIIECEDGVEVGSYV